MTKEKKERNKTPDLNSRTGKYFLARKKGLRQKDAAELLNIHPHYAPRLEKTKAYQALVQTYYKDELLTRVTMGQIAEEHAKNILQDQDKGAKNTAIKMALDKVEPSEMSREDDKLIVVLRA